MYKKFAWLTLGLAMVSVLMIHNVRAPISADTPLSSSEQAVDVIPLTGPLANRNAEVSGLAWYHEHLIMLPQYPERLGANRGNLFALPKADILAFLNGEILGPLEPRPIPIEGPDLSRQINGFQGYEAIAFAENQAFITVEAEENNSMLGYLITGRIANDLSRFELNVDNQVRISPQSSSPNKADEALLVADGQVLSIYEVNGVRLNPSPRVHAFDFDLTALKTLPFPNLEYRLTDVTAVDNTNRFWAINYFFTGDRDLVSQQDLLAVRYGRGPTHRRQKTVERLVEFVYDETGITLTDNAPIQLELGQTGRNWEGLVRLEDKGFLVMTDKFPETIFGFVAMPANEKEP